MKQKVVVVVAQGPRKCGNSLANGSRVVSLCSSKLQASHFQLVLDRFSQDTGNPRIQVYGARERSAKVRRETHFWEKEYPPHMCTYMNIYIYM